MLAESRSPRLYRSFQKFALIVGLALSATAWAIESTETIYAGLIIALHGLIASIILLVDVGRMSAQEAKDSIHLTGL